MVITFNIKVTEIVIKKSLLPKEYLDMIKLYLSNIQNNHKKMENLANNANQFYFL